MKQTALPVSVCKSDLQNAIKYLDDARQLYDALAALGIQKFNCRSHMIKQLTTKLKSKLLSSQRDAFDNKLLTIQKNEN